jgi:hypothetical protein
MSRPIILFPGETVLDALKRRVKFHEFLMAGGIQIGYSADGIMIYSGAVSPATHESCPWHGDDCNAWDEITEGRGYGPDSTSLNVLELRDMTEDERVSNRIIAESTTATTAKPKLSREKMTEALGVETPDEIKFEDDEEDEEEEDA